MYSQITKFIFHQLPKIFFLSFLLFSPLFFPICWSICTLWTGNCNESSGLGINIQQRVALELGEKRNGSLLSKQGSVITVKFYCLKFSIEYSILHWRMIKQETNRLNFRECICQCSKFWYWVEMWTDLLQCLNSWFIELLTSSCTNL